MAPAMSAELYGIDINPTAAGVGVTGGSGRVGPLFFLFGVDGLASLVEFEDSKSPRGAAFLFLVVVVAGDAPALVALATFATGEAVATFEAFSAIAEAALSRADRLEDIVRYLELCIEKLLVFEENS